MSFICYNEKGMFMDILLVEDNVSIAKGLEYSFKQNNYNLIVKNSIKDTITFLENNKVSLIILDITLPDGNGLKFYNEYLSSKNIPTIFLTANDCEDDIVEGLNSGADDYITKPFSVKELLARVNRIIVRNKNNEKIKVQDITFDIDKMEVYKNNELLSFTSLELKILYLLFTNLNKVVTRNYIIDSIWEWTGNDVNDNTVTVYLKRIREKLKSDIIITIKGIGYRIDEEIK